MNNNKCLYILLIILFLSGCYLLEDPLSEIEYNVSAGQYTADSMYIDSAGLYEIVINASFPVDIIFFNNSEGIDDFAEGNVYSQNVLYPLFFESTVYEDEEIFIYNESVYIYYIIDNTGFLTSPEDDAEVTIKVYLKEE